MRTPLKSNHPGRRHPPPAKGLCAGCSVLFGPKHMENWACFPSCGHNLPAVFKSASLRASKLPRSCCFVAAFFPRAPQAGLSQPSPAQPWGLPAAQIPNPTVGLVGTGGSYCSLQPQTRSEGSGDTWQEGTVEIPSRAGTASKGGICRDP